MVFRMRRFSKTTDDASGEVDTIEPKRDDAQEMGGGITVRELEVVLGSLYTAPSLKDY